MGGSRASVAPEERAVQGECALPIVLVCQYAVMSLVPLQKALSSAREMPSADPEAMALFLVP